MRYDPNTFKALTFHDALPHFATGTDTPRAYLERCFAQIALREPIVKAFVVINETLARTAADASSARWKAGQPLSAIDGMPVAVNSAVKSAANSAANLAVSAALREAGAVILGRTVTAEFAGAHPGPTTHPFDVTRTPGGSSAGSAAAVAARMCSAALGAQAGGGGMQSASCCANFAFEPTPGAFDGSVHAGSIEDLWQVATAIARRAGGDPGHAGHYGNYGHCGPGFTPAATRPRALIVIESTGWRAADEATRTAFAALLDQIACTGVTLLRRRDHPSIEAFEQAIAMTPDDDVVLLRRRSLAQHAHAALAPLADAIVTLSSPGPAPVWAADPPGDTPAPRRSNDPLCNTPHALLHAPAVTLPLMGVDGMPVGAQLTGQRGDDARLVSLARWVALEAGTVVV